MEDRRGIGANCGPYVNNLRAQVNLAGCHLATDIVFIRGSLLLWVWFNQITGSCCNKHVLLKCIAEFASICSFQVQLRTPVNLRSTETKTRSCNYGSFWSLHHKLWHGTREYFHISVAVNMSMSTAEKDRVINELPKVSRMVNFYSQVINMTKFKRIWNILSQCRGMTISQVTVGT